MPLRVIVGTGPSDRSGDMPLRVIVGTGPSGRSGSVPLRVIVGTDRPFGPVRKHAPSGDIEGAFGAFGAFGAEKSFFDFFDFFDFFGGFGSFWVVFGRFRGPKSVFELFFVSGMP